MLCGGFPLPGVSRPLTLVPRLLITSRTARRLGNAGMGGAFSNGSIDKLCLSTVENYPCAQLRLMSTSSTASSMSATHQSTKSESTAMSDASGGNKSSAVPAGGSIDKTVAKKGGASSDGGDGNTRKILSTLLHYTWPAGQPALRARVVAALGLLIGGKLLNIQVPFFFKSIVDTLSVGSATATSALAAADAALAPVTGAPLSVSVPFAMLIGYGIARASSTGFNELRNTIFASVAQRAIRLVSRDVFR